MTLILNTSVAVDVSFLAREIVDASDPENIVYGDPLPGVRLDVQRETLDLYPALQTFAVTPGNPVHDCGPNGVRLFADTLDEIIEAAPVVDSPWSLFMEAPDE